MALHQINFNDVDMSIPDDWVTTDDLAEVFSNIPKKTIRHLINHRKEKGLEPACKRLGRFIFINKKGFAHWMVNS